MVAGMHPPEPEAQKRQLQLDEEKRTLEEDRRKRAKQEEEERRAEQAAEQEKKRQAEMAPLLVYTPTLLPRTVSPRLQAFAAAHLSPSPERRCDLRAVEAGGGGDCLFHSFAAALEQMLLHDQSAAEHVLAKVPLEVLRGGKNAMVTHLRRLSADALNDWSPEELLDYIVRAAMDKRLGTFEDSWEPELLLRQSDLDCLKGCESVLAYGDAPHGGAGDAAVRLAFTDARPGAGARREEIVYLEHGHARLAELRRLLQQELVVSGNWHWGTQFDVNNLSRVLDLGVLMFCDRLQSGGRECLYNIGSETENFPYWIALWWEEPVHFRLLQVSYVDVHASAPGDDFTCVWKRESLPDLLWQQYRHCNRLSN